MWRGTSLSPLHRLLLLPVSDRKSTRLNSSHSSISYAVFCLKKKKNALICGRLVFLWPLRSLCVVAFFVRFLSSALRRCWDLTYSFRGRVVFHCHLPIS